MASEYETASAQERIMQKNGKRERGNEAGKRNEMENEEGKERSGRGWANIVVKERHEGGRVSVWGFSVFMSVVLVRERKGKR